MRIQRLALTALALAALAASPLACLDKGSSGKSGGSSEGEGEGQAEGEGESQIEGEGEGQAEGEGESQIEGEGESQIEGEGESQTEGEGEGQAEGEGEGERATDGSAEGEGEGEGEGTAEGESIGPECTPGAVRSCCCEQNGGRSYVLCNDQGFWDFCRCVEWAVETECDGADEGRTWERGRDEELASAACSFGDAAGVCHAGLAAWRGGQWVCDPSPDPAPDPALCACDPQEEFWGQPPLPLDLACDGEEDLDAFAEGQVGCAADGSLLCTDFTGDEPDLCNGRDDDGDGQVDEDAPPVTSRCGVGACGREVVVVCQDGGYVDTCQPGEPVAEIPDNGLDDDCDGVTDEGPDGVGRWPGPCRLEVGPPPPGEEGGGWTFDWDDQARLRGWVRDLGPDEEFPASYDREYALGHLVREQQGSSCSANDCYESVERVYDLADRPLASWFYHREGPGNGWWVNSSTLTWLHDDQGRVIAERDREVRDDIPETALRGRRYDDQGQVAAAWAATVDDMSLSPHIQSYSFSRSDEPIPVPHLDPLPPDPQADPDWAHPDDPAKHYEFDEHRNLLRAWQGDADAPTWEKTFTYDCWVPVPEMAE